MDKEPEPFDVGRILVGDAPPWFLGEVAIRALLVLGCFVIAGRLLGKRMNGQLTVVEFAVMLTLGAIIAPAIQLPERGVLMAVMALTFAVAFQRLTTLGDFRSARFERLTQGQGVTVIKDGVFQVAAMRRGRLSKHQLLALLRSKGIRHLGEVERLHLEACGSFSLFRSECPSPGLSVIPDQDLAMKREGAALSAQACRVCGLTVQSTAEPCCCPHCSNHQWEPSSAARSKRTAFTD